MNPVAPALEIPRERRVEHLVVVVDAEDRHVVGVGHDTEVLGVNVAGGQHGRHPGILAGHVPVEQQRRAAEEREPRTGQLVELPERLLVVPGDAQLVILADRLADMHAPIVAPQRPRQGHHLAGGARLRQQRECLHPRCGSRAAVVVGGLVARRHPAAGVGVIGVVHVSSNVLLGGLGGRCRVPATFSAES